MSGIGNGPDLLFDRKRRQFQVDVIIENLRSAGDPAHHIDHPVAVDGKIWGGHLPATADQGYGYQGQDEAGIKETEVFQRVEHDV